MNESELEKQIIHDTILATLKEERAMREELAALRKALDDRRTVEIFCRLKGGMFEFSFRHMSLHIRYQSNQVCFEGLPNEAFSAAAEWVRGQG